MTPLSKRLQRLEAAMKWGRGLDIGVVYRAALTKLTARDGDLVAEVLGRRASPDAETHHAALSRFDAAYAEAAAELQVPIVLTAADFLL
jgi:hypothetical protein